MKKRSIAVSIPTLLLAICLDSPDSAADPPADGLEPQAPELERRSEAIEARAEEVQKLEEAAEKNEEEREVALTSFVQLLGDDRAQATTSGESSAAFGGAILYRGQRQSILILARSDAGTGAMDTQAERGALMLTPEASGQPSFEFDWRVYFFCMNEIFRWRRGACADDRGAAGEKVEADNGSRREGRLRRSVSAATRDPDDVDFGFRLYLSGGTSDWTIPTGDPADEITRRAGVLAYGADLALRRELIKGQDNYVALEAGVGVTARNLIGDLTADEHRADLEGFLGTDRKFYVGPEVYIGLTINALNLGISLPIIPYGEVDGFSGGQLLVTAIVRDGPKLVMEE